MCGIFGFVNKKPKEFDYTAFTTLGIANDSRGGDSCGVFIDGKFEYGVKEDKLFQTFFLRNNFLEQFWNKKVSIALGHCRKASVGNISRETAQPVVLQDKAGNVRFVLIHNGTIHNYKELAQKYIPGVDITGMTDSQVMARIFYYKGYDCLDEYNGGAVFFIVDYRQPSPLCLVWKGASKKTKYAKDAVDERPLFFKCDDEELVFSSIYVWLEALRPLSRVYSLAPNVLWKFTGKKLVQYKSYPRENAQQDKEYARTTYYDDTYFSPYRTSTAVYLSANKLTNIYTDSSKAAHGKLSLNYMGKIARGTDSNSKFFSRSSVSAYDNYSDVYFYGGVALSSGKWFKILEKFRKRLKLSEEEFVKNYQTLVRYLSYDKVFFEGEKLVEATSPDETTPFTGTFQMIGTQYARRYENGSPIGVEFHQDYQIPYKKATESPDLVIKPKDLKTICRQLLMK